MVSIEHSGGVSKVRIGPFTNTNLPKVTNIELTFKIEDKSSNENYSFTRTVTRPPIEEVVEEVVEEVDTDQFESTVKDYTCGEQVAEETFFVEIGSTLRIELCQYLETAGQHFTSIEF